MQNYNVLWGSHVSLSSACRKLSNTTHCLTVLWLVVNIMGWDSIHNPLLQSALKSYKAITGLQVALSSASPMLTNLNLMNVGTCREL